MPGTDIATASANLMKSLREFGGGGDFIRLKFSQGNWSLDGENIEPEDSVFVVDPRAMQMGWILWGDGEPIDEGMAFTMEPPIVADDLPVPENPEQNWQRQFILDLGYVCGDADVETAQAVRFSTSSWGGTRMCVDLLKGIVQHIEDGEPAHMPAIMFNTRERRSKKYGVIKEPYFKTLAWFPVSTDAEELKNEVLAMLEDGAEEPEPKAKAKRSAGGVRRRFT